MDQINASNEQLDAPAVVDHQVIVTNVIQPQATYSQTLLESHLAQVDLQLIFLTLQDVFLKDSNAHLDTR